MKKVILIDYIILGLLIAGMLLYFLFPNSTGIQTIYVFVFGSLLLFRVAGVFDEFEEGEKK